MWIASGRSVTSWDLKTKALVPGFNCGFHESGIFKASQENDFRQCADFFQAAGGLKAVHHWHHDVEHENIGLQTQRRLDCLLSVKYGANYLELGSQEAGKLRGGSARLSSASKTRGFFNVQNSVLYRGDCAAAPAQSAVFEVAAGRMTGSAKPGHSQALQSAPEHRRP